MSLKPNSDWFDTLPRERLMAEYSLWSADLANLEADILRVDDFVDLYHADAADGRFAPSFLMFPDQIARIRKLTAKPIHVHLMIEGDILLSQIRQFAEAGADLISFHPETGDVTSAGLDLIAELGVKAGLVLRLETPVSALAPYVSMLDFVTLLGTAIGVKGQGLSETACPRLQEAGALIAASGRDNAVLAADGGIRETTVPLLRQAGAQTVVMGSLAFNDPDLPARMAWLRAL
ncbi:ribulose-phosphate 3-epimerase [Rhizobium sp. FKL33]|uniref:ribulose-phosphate 3-epimerase n=1 Tax=Rhizobium sp. FKL33 TaxID=2562307 RepID=UPI0010C04D93|nr:ribulose-phosphate 3-epimerase [Rhizobium sp. FKL33]